MSDFVQSSEDQKTERNIDDKDQAQEVSIGNTDSIFSSPQGHMYYALAEKLCTFCLHPKTLGETEVNGSGLINLEEEISRQINIHAVE